MKRSLAIVGVITVSATVVVFASCKPRQMGATASSSVANAQQENTGGGGYGSGTASFKIPQTVEECMEHTLEGRSIAKLPDPEDYYIDAVCSDLFTKKYDPQGNGYIALFGSSSLRASHISYHSVHALASQWTKAQQARGAQAVNVPFLTATGPGVMEAANCGVNGLAPTSDPATKKQYRDELRANRDQKIPSLGFGTTFGVPSALKDKGFQSGSEAWEINDCTTHGYIFHSFRMRESEMIDRARISLVAPGGVGTEWEIFEILSKIQTKKAPNNAEKKPPLVILYYGNDFDYGAKSEAVSAELSKPTVAGPDYKKNFGIQKGVIAKYWKTLMARMDSMCRAGVIKAEDLHIMKCAHNAKEAIELMNNELYGTPLTGKAGLCEGIDFECDKGVVK